MPLRRDHLNLALLFLCVPVQYLVVQYMGSTENNRTYAISKLVNEIQDFKLNWPDVNRWIRAWCAKIFIKALKRSGIPIKEDYSSAEDAEDEDDVENGESPAFEVLKFREKEGYFARSTIVRATRSPEVKYRVGQVIKHKLWGYRGVIIGWDEVAKAPEPWIRQMHGEDKPHWATQPNYSILVDTRDRSVPQVTYVPQENLEILHQAQVIHPALDDHFENFDGSQYLPRPWLRAIYPKD